ncbi:nucleotidyltransferase domain-containing protein [Vulcanisaeta distributa]|uniref:DNA polymerase beta domain protein region n=1 Tax=Vulcanisaeta distributa (strain DSM 14429 / JCM 11212 / NBRC 100878 / IC-017) TaxID=572478 RepID=E1QTY8_VULDI|nr:nucleotidyltransferase domain-containing protein [Vulcanisaeta distributa]ADN49785.1 DNA polymerase beta domain protein region [Vulcanisaeta distributa DSM 14429]
MINCQAVINDVRAKLSRLVGGSFMAVLLFGSLARCEADEYSDVDLLVLHSGLGRIDRVKRRRAVYLAISALLRDYPLTVIDMDINEFLNPGIITPLLLNIYWDAMVLLDRTGKLNEFLEQVRRRIVESGLRRIRDGKAYYWVLPKPLERVRII